MDSVFYALFFNFNFCKKRKVKFRNSYSIFSITLKKEKWNIRIKIQFSIYSEAKIKRQYFVIF